MSSEFALTEEDVLGERMAVFANRATSLGQLVAASRAYGDREYVVFGDTRLSFAEHHRVVAGLTTVLQRDYGVRRGTRVALLGANSAEWVATFWAIVSLGGVAVPLNAWWTPNELTHALKDADPDLLCVDSAHPNRAAWAGPVFDLDGALEHPRGDALPDFGIGEDDPALMLFTSGTTGRAKGAVHSQRNVVALVQAQAYIAAERMRAAGFTGDPPPLRIFTTSPLFHISGLHSSAIAGLASGATHVWYAGRFDPVAVMETIEREKCTNWSSVPTAVARVVNHPDVAKHDLTSMRHVGGGGAAWSPALQDRMREVFGANLTAGVGYGLTECGGLATVASSAELAAHPTTCGRTLPTVQVAIRDADGRDIPDGTEGEICVRSPLVMLGYWRNPDATNAVVGAGRWLRTGDIGYLDDGLLYLSSRRHDLILRGGDNVYPVEVENVLEGHPAIEECVVIGMPHDDLGQEVVAVLVLRADAAATADELTAYVRERIAGYKVPTLWVFRAAPLPRTATDKVVRADIVRELEGAL